MLRSAGFKNIPWHLFQDEPGAHLDSSAGVEDDRPNSVSGSSAALHHPAGLKKKRHRIPRQDKDQQVNEGFVLVFSPWDFTGDV